MNVQRFTTLAALLFALFAGAAPAAAQSVQLEFHDGRVNLTAHNATLRTILSEWARLGGTKIVNGDRVAGGPLTLELSNVPERQAMEILLRGVSGYLISPQPLQVAGRSAFDSVLILPTTSVVPPAMPALAPGAAAGRPAPAQLFLNQDDPDDEAGIDVVNGNQQRPDGTPRNRTPRLSPPRGVNENGPIVMPEAFRPIPGEAEAPPEDRPTVANPFGVPPGSARPGVITPVPQQPQPNDRGRVVGGVIVQDPGP